MKRALLLLLPTLCIGCGGGDTSIHPSASGAALAARQGTGLAHLYVFL